MFQYTDDIFRWEFLAHSFFVVPWERPTAPHRFKVNIVRDTSLSSLYRQKELAVRTALRERRKIFQSSSLLLLDVVTSWSCGLFFFECGLFHRCPSTHDPTGLMCQVNCHSLSSYLPPFFSTSILQLQISHLRSIRRLARIFTFPFLSKCIGTWNEYIRTTRHIFTQRHEVFLQRRWSNKAFYNGCSELTNRNWRSCQPKEHGWCKPGHMWLSHTCNFAVCWYI